MTAAAVVALCILGSACDASPPAATVNGATITQSQLNSQLSAISQSAYVRCALELQGSIPNSVQGAANDTVSTELASDELSTMIIEELLSQDLSGLHRTVGASDLDAARADFEARLEPTPQEGGTSPCGYGGRQLDEHLPAAFSALQVRYLAEQEQLAASLGHLDLTTQALERYYFSHAANFAEVCLSDIAVTSQSQAQSIAQQIASGTTTFADAARKISIDTSTAANGGAIPCVPASEIQNSSVLSAIDGLGAGQVSRPVQETSSTGAPVWLLLQVSGRPEVPFSQAEPQIRQDILASQSSELSKEFHAIAKTAQVYVDPRFGTWSHLRGVVPPVPPASRYVLAPSANLPPSFAASPGG
jgi:PPIC-type PPIASE domain